MEIFEKLQAIIADQLELDEDTITYDSHILDDLGADSLDVVDLIMSVEDEFGVEVPDEALENIRTVEDMVKYIEDNM
ncbi:MAG: acyl carrier protein [Clostridia bacterium]|nr:acyl carrier protein [Clostridia bacterium]MBQ3127552.1 acyl carrier protein [Clostridia bacterium]MBQ7043979.1 acyl carrier protein [Clostridia bacterium]